jgi:hypothetical protein
VSFIASPDAVIGRLAHLLVGHADHGDRRKPAAQVHRALDLGRIAVEAAVRSLVRSVMRR